MYFNEFFSLKLIVLVCTDFGKKKYFCNSKALALFDMKYCLVNKDKFQSQMVLSSSRYVILIIFIDFILLVSIDVCVEVVVVDCAIEALIGEAKRETH